MVFVKISVVKGRKYKSLVEGYRDFNGKVKHRFIKYLGPLNPIRKRKNPNVGRKPKLKVRGLTKEEKDFVKQNIKNSKSFIKDRVKIITLSIGGKTVKQICQKLGFYRSKVEKIIKRFNEEGLKIFERSKSPGRPRRITKKESKDSSVFEHTS